jgi:hypothetical protein
MTMNKNDRLRIYEKFFHRINLYCVSLNNEKVREAVSLIDSWSFAHRCGNGEFSEREQHKLVESAIQNMEKWCLSENKESK